MPRHAGAARRSQHSRSVEEPGGYVGSGVCAQCHRPIYNSFSRTDMGRSMSAVTPSVLTALPTMPASVFDSQHNRHFSVFVRDGQLFQSEWATGADGKDVFRETERVEWIIGAGANGMGALVRRGDSIFEAPLSFLHKNACVGRVSWLRIRGLRFQPHHRCRLHRVPQRPSESGAESQRPISRSAIRPTRDRLRELSRAGSRSRAGNA